MRLHRLQKNEIGYFWWNNHKYLFMLITTYSFLKWVEDGDEDGGGDAEGDAEGGRDWGRGRDREGNGDG